MVLFCKDTMQSTANLSRRFTHVPIVAWMELQGNLLASRTWRLKSSPRKATPPYRIVPLQTSSSSRLADFGLCANLLPSCRLIRRPIGWEFGGKGVAPSEGRGASTTVIQRSHPFGIRSCRTLPRPPTQFRADRTRARLRGLSSMTSVSMESAAEAAQRGDVAFFEAIDEAVRTDLLRARDEDGRSVLHWAAASMQGGAILDHLLANGGQELVRQADEESWTPLHSAVSIGNETVAMALIDAGADVNATTSGGQTPMHYAASKGRASILELLLDSGASLEVKDRNGCTPLLRAASCGKILPMKILIERGANVTSTDKMGDTALHLAIECGHKDAALFLVAEGSSLGARNKAGKTPLEINEEIARVIMSARQESSWT